MLRVALVVRASHRWAGRALVRKEDKYVLLDAQTGRLGLCKGRDDGLLRRRLEA